MKIKRERRKKCPDCDITYPGWHRFGPGPYDLEPCGCDEPPEEPEPATISSGKHGEGG